MRLHEHFPALWPKYDEDFVREMLRVEHLVAVRLEPVYSIRFEAFMDAMFERAGRWLVVPMMRIEGVSIMVPENPPVTWPVSYERLASAHTDEIDAEIVPWLRSITAGRLVNDEHLRFFRETPEIVDAYEEARRQRLIGAAAYPDVLKSAGAAVYALRFARDGHVALRGADAANGAAILSNVASSIDAEISPFARRWLSGIAIGEIDATKTYECYVGPRNHAPSASYGVFQGDESSGERRVALAEPIPTDVTISFDLEDAPESHHFSVTEARVDIAPMVLHEPPVAGGSTGTIRLVVRDDAKRFPDADTDAAESLAARLRAEGFDAAVTLAPQVDREQADVIHVFGLRHGAGMVELLRDAEERNIPVIVTPYADDRRNEAISGASGSLLIPRVSGDTITFYDFVTAFAGRKVANLTQGAWYDDVSDLLLRRASAVIVSGPSEVGFLRERFGYGGTAIPAGPLVPRAIPQPEIGALVGPGQYILIHGPIEPRNNQVYAMLAAIRAGLPIVLMGPVADIEFFRYVNEWAGPNAIQLRDQELSDAEIAAVYARARVVADVGWSARGLERLARGAAFGAGVVASDGGYAQDVFGELLTAVDPASLDSIAEGFKRAWERAPGDRSAMLATAARAADPLGALVAAVSAYQQASSQPVR